MLSFLAAALLAASPPSSGPALRLSDLLAEARARNPDLRAANFRADGASAAAGGAGALDDPRFLVELWNAPADFSTVPVMFQLTQGFPLGGKLGLRRKVAEAEATAARAEAQAATRGVEAEVARAYFELYRAQRTAEIDVALRPVLEALRQAAGARLRTGKGEQAEMLKAEAGQLELEEDVTLAGQEEGMARARLGALLDRPPDFPGTTVPPRILPELPSLEALRTRALEHRSEVKVAQAMAQGASLQLQLAEAERVPDLGALFGYMYAFNQPGERNFLFAGLEINLPWLWGRTESRVSSARTLGEAASAARAGVAARIGGEVGDALARVRAQERVAELHHRLIPILQAALDSSRASYASGRGDFLLVLDTVRELRRHQLELTMALAAYGRALADLQRAVGEDVGLLAAAEGGADDAHH
jgi:outer membrane protein, heavy metal efflux system